MENGPPIPDVKAYFRSLDYDLDESLCIGNCEWWVYKDDPDENYFIVTWGTLSHVSPTILGKLLSKASGNRADFITFLRARRAKTN